MGIRGRRKYVIGVGCAILALLAVAILLLTSGSADSGGRNSSHRAASPFEKHLEQIEKRLAKSPDDKKALLALMRIWIKAGNNRLGKVANTATEPIPSAVSEDFRAGLRAWNRYLKAGGEANVNSAEVASGTYFQLVEIGSRNLAEVESNAAGAARAQRIAGQLRPNLFTLSNVAVYDYFNGEFAAGDKAAKGAAADVTPKEAKGVEVELDEYRERGEKFTKRVRRAAELLRESGQEQLPTPLKGYGSPAGINGGE